MPTFKHWRLETDSDKVAWLYFDKENASVNTIDRDVMEELNLLLDEVANKKTEIKGFIIASAKRHGFIAGADISQFGKFKNIDDAVALLRRGQSIIDKIENLDMPSVAMIDGFCLGGGLELALGCHYRVAEDGPKTRLGLPEVKLGIHPGWGGTVRIPRLCGALQGLNLVLSGRALTGKAAAKLGFVDSVVPKRHLVKAAKYYVLNSPGKHKAKWWQSITHWKPVRTVIAQIFRNKLRAKISSLHYPAPFQVIDNWEKVGVADDKAQALEAKTCGRLFFSDTSRNLVRVFFLQERLKGFAKDEKFSPKLVHVVGAGTMGGDIAAWCALRGMRVTLQDRSPEFIAPAIKRAAKLFKAKLKQPHLIQRAMDNLIPDVDGRGIATADVIIEAIFEDLTAKQELFKSLEAKAKSDAILATNTSSILLDDINKVLKNPERLVGVHFFNPVAKMMLVEIVEGEKTKAKVRDRATCFVRAIDRLPLPVKSRPGFLVNRILMPYLLEAVTLLEEGVEPLMIDKAMTEFGMPMGPIALADTVGLDVCHSVAKYLTQYYPTDIPKKLVELIDLGKMGRKTGEGFYRYKNGNRVKSSVDIGTEGKRAKIAERLVLRILDEAFACLREGVVSDSDLLDAGMVLGTGFAPFHGGPINYAKAKGITELFDQFADQLEKRGGKKNSLKKWETPVEV